ncbi:MAG TPA: FKBP-type peptidyl-prolyl cis-trans isomerase [Pelobium sp.]
MKNCFYILLFAVLGFAACKKEKYVDYQALALEQYGKDTVIINKFIADNNIPAKKDSTIDIYYQIIEPGTGDEVNWTANSLITAKYDGRFLNGTSFDKSDSAIFELGRVIAGWQIGIPKIKKGGKIRLIIPSGFAYGDRGSGQIPPNSILDFDIELLDIK